MVWSNCFCFRRIIEAKCAIAMAGRNIMSILRAGRKMVDLPLPSHYDVIPGSFIDCTPGIITITNLAIF